MNKDHILYEYDKYVKKYKNIYGPNTIVLIQLGSFFEICANLDSKNMCGETDINHICDDILSIAVGKKTIKSHDTLEYLMAGFPLVSQEKHISNLLNNDYTVVLIEQITEPPNPERKATQILSPGTSIIHNKEYNNYLMSIYIECYDYKGDGILKAGISAIDLSTGNSMNHMIDNVENDNNFCIDEISRYINFYNPKECIFQCTNYQLSHDDILNKWDLNTKCFRINHFTDSIYKKPSYQRDVLMDIYRVKNMVDVFDILYLDHDEIRLSFVYLILYIREHKRDILENIEYPKKYNEKGTLILTSNSIRQLNIINNYSYFKGKNESLLSICNICMTSMGKRLLKNRLLYPSTDKDVLKSRYDNIEYYIRDDHYKIIRDDLYQINDLDKSLRLMALNILMPYNFYSTILSYEFVKKCLNKIDNLVDDKKNIEIFDKFMQDVRETFDFQKVTNDPIINIRRSIFKPNKFNDIDRIDSDILNLDCHIECICNRLSKFIDDKNDVIKCTDGKDGEWFLYCTKRRAQTFKQRMSNIGDTNIHVKDSSNETIYTFKRDDFVFKTKDGNSTYILCNTMKDISKKKYDLYKSVSELNSQYYNDTIKYLYDNYSITLKTIHDLIGNIDFYSSGAKLSIDNNYYKPNISDCKDSMINAVDMRHPIVECINRDTEYVVNDVNLCNNGILLFGTNACGKSTYMKAIGLNLIMAQAGLYVACKSFEFVPYTQIFTRILNNDNIFKSESTFAVEMNELRSIVNLADDKSLVLGDELCSGTETISAIKIVYAGLHTLCNRKCSFVFTSHLHQLMDLNEIHELHNLNVYHLAIINDNGTLIYNRKLKKGPGPSIYGMKVCEALGLPQDFLDIANGINIIEDKPLKTSPYNKKIVLDKCKVCNDVAEETHHIVEQCEADSNGNFTHFHKNNIHNLVQLCKKCHDNVTYGNLVIEGYVQTDKGIVLKYHNVDKKRKPKKYDDVLEKITSYKSDYETNIKNCIRLLQLNEDISIGRETLKKIMDNKY